MKPKYQDRPQFKAIDKIESAFQKKADFAYKNIVKEITAKLNDNSKPKS